MGFRKGQSGNPGGRPKQDLCLTSLLRAALAERDADKKKTKARLLVDALLNEGIKGNTRAINAILDRIEGPVQMPEQRSGDLAGLAGEAEARAEQLERERREGTADRAAGPQP